mgnify:FL=1|tara:strand:- start:4658 stop:5941 length:1284 start_codon:yes stop_codon:yes gene_type:complete
MIAQDIIQDSLKNEKLRIANARRDEIRRMVDYYTDCETDKYIIDHFNSQAFREIPPYSVNFTRRFINKMSRIYTLGADRNVSDEYLSLTRKKNARMKHIERMTRLVGTIANRVMVKEDANGTFFDYRPIYYYNAFFDDDPFLPMAITYPLLLPVNDISDSGKLEYAYWDDTHYAQYDEDGNITMQYEHGFGMLPFVFTHREDQIDSHFVEGANDIVNVNEQVNITMTEMQLGLRFQMFGQPVTTGADIDVNTIRTGSDSILGLPEGSTFDIVAPEGDINAVIENVKFQIELVASNNHLMINWAEQGGEMPSGVSLMIKDLERTEDYYDDLELFRMYEEEFFIVEKAVGQANNINLPNNFGVNFVEPEYPQSIQDQIAWNTYRLSNNLTTRPKLLNEINTDLSLEEAEQIVNANAVVNQEILNEQNRT